MRAKRTPGQNESRFVRAFREAACALRAERAEAEAEARINEIKFQLKKADDYVINAIHQLEIVALQACAKKAWGIAEQARYIAITLRAVRGEGEPGTGLAGLVEAA